MLLDAAARVRSGDVASRCPIARSSSGLRVQLSNVSVKLRKFRTVRGAVISCEEEERRGKRKCTGVRLNTMEQHKTKVRRYFADCPVVECSVLPDRQVVGRSSLRSHVRKR